MPQPEPRFDTFRLQTQWALDAEIDSLIVIDRDGDVNQVIDTDTPFDIEVKWHVSGLIAPALNGCFWKIEVYAESIGPKPEVLLASDPNVPCNSRIGRTDFVKRFNNINPVDLNGNKLEGPYKLTLVITSHNSAGDPLHLAGFIDGPLVQFYTA